MNLKHSLACANILYLAPIFYILYLAFNPTDWYLFLTLARYLFFDCQRVAEIRGNRTGMRVECEFDILMFNISTFYSILIVNGTFMNGKQLHTL